MEELLKADKLLDSIEVKGQSVFFLAQARQLIAQAYKELTKENDNG